MIEGIPFIPAWLDDANLSQAEFRVYSHLCRRADNKTGIAWPAVEGTDEESKRTSIVVVCGMARRTVWKTIKSLEARGLIKKVGRPFGGSNRYMVLAPTGAIEALVDSAAISANEAPVGNAPSGAIEAPSSSANGTLQPAQSRPREGSPLKVPQESSPNTLFDFDDAPEPASKPKPPSPDTQLAEAIYQAYPRKKKRPDALRAILKAMKSKPGDWLLSKTEEYAKAIVWMNPNYIPYPATWFNSESFNDSPEEWEDRRGNTAPTGGAVNLGRRNPKWTGPPEDIDLPIDDPPAVGAGTKRRDGDYPQEILQLP